jgi:hypothetical protein
VNVGRTPTAGNFLSFFRSHGAWFLQEKLSDYIFNGDAKVIPGQKP